MVAIVSAKRTPIGRFLGSLAGKSSVELGAAAIKASMKDANLKPADVDEVIMGNVLQAGTGQNPARLAAVKAGLPYTTPAFTVNKVCGSGMKAIMLAADRIRLDEANIIVAGGMESMSNAPHLFTNSRSTKRYGDIGAKEMPKRFKLIDSMIHDGLYDCMYGRHMGDLCVSMINKYDITRKRQDAFALESHRRAVAARTKMREEITPVNRVAVDEHPRPDTSLEKLGSLPAVFGKSITAGNASGLNDAGAALVLMSDREAKRRKLKPLAKIIDHTIAAVDPKWFTLAPVPAVRSLLKRSKLKMKDIDLVELNEAYAAQALAVMDELKIPHEKLNVNGGAVALGHPIGASGARIIVTLLHEMRRTYAKRGLAALCIGGGGATAMLFKR